MHPVLPEFISLCEELLEASEEWERRHADYEAVRPTNRVARLVRIPGVLLNRDEGKFGVEVTVRPKRKPLEAARAENLRALVDSSTQRAVADRRGRGGWERARRLCDARPVAAGRRCGHKRLTDGSCRRVRLLAQPDYGGTAPLRTSGHGGTMRSVMACRQRRGAVVDDDVV